jgi:hypothetical protein
MLVPSRSEEYPLELVSGKTDEPTWLLDENGIIVKPFVIFHWINVEGNESKA